MSALASELALPSVIQMEKVTVSASALEWPLSMPVANHAIALTGIWILRAG